MTLQADSKFLRGFRSCAALALIGAAFTSAAQTTSPNPAPAPNGAPAAGYPGPTTAQVTSNSEAPPNENNEVHVLSPFDVFGEAEVGYQAKTTLAATRLATNLDDVGDALQVVTAQFMKDTGATDNSSLLTYTTGTEVGGIHGNWEGSGNGPTVTDANINNPNLNVRIRGLTNADSTRDFEQTTIPWDAYNVDTVEIQRGANAILFGLGSPSGLVNASLKQADYVEGGSIGYRFGSYNSQRSTLDYDHVLVKNQLAIRLDVLNDDENYEASPAYNNDRRIFGALRYDPAFLNKGSAHSTFRINYEQGEIKANNPPTLPPLDELTPFFLTGTTNVNGVSYNNPNQALLDYRYRNLYEPNVPGSGWNVATSPNYQPWNANNSLFEGFFTVFNSGGTSKQTGPYLEPSLSPNYNGTPYGIGTASPALGANGQYLRTGNIGGLSQQLLTTIGTLPLYGLSVPGYPFADALKQRTLSDPTIFDFYHNMLGGPNNWENQDFSALNAVFTQTFLDNHIGLEAVYDRQRNTQVSYQPFNNGSDGVLTVDDNAVLPDGTPNPNAGRPMVLWGSYAGGSYTSTLSQDSRLTGFVDYKAEDFLHKSWVTDIIGRHVFTGVLNYTDSRSTTEGGAFSAIDNTGATSDPDGIIGSSLIADRTLTGMTYLGPSVIGRSSASGLGLPGVTAVQTPQATSVEMFDSRWKQPTDPSAVGYVNPAAPWFNPLTQGESNQSNNPANYVGWTTVPVQTLNWKQDQTPLVENAQMTEETVSSKIFVWQGYMFGGDIVPMIGYRRDTAKAYEVSAPTLDTVAQLGAPSYFQPSSPFSTVTGTTKSFSVVLHTPKFITKYFPTGMDVSFFINGSKDFEPSAGRVDMLNQPLPAPSGRTKDYGMIVSAFHGRVSLKATVFEDSANGSTDSNLVYQWLTGTDLQRAWLLANRYLLGATGNPLYAGSSFNYGTTVNGVFTQTAADKAEQIADANALLASPLLTPQFFKAWGISTDPSNYAPGGAFLNDIDPLGYPPGLTATQDNTSRGCELELYFNPVKNLDIAINADHTTAVGNDNIGGGVNPAFLAAEYQLFSGPAGNIRRYTGDVPPTTTIGAQFMSNVWGPYVVQQALDGSGNAELRPWRANGTLNYRFSRGVLKGFNLGGGYQWQDRIIIGYPLTYITSGTTKNEAPVLNSPYYGPTDTTTNLWIGYTRKLTRNISWNIQLNVNNALGHNELVPINTEPDGSIGAYRIKDGPEWTIANSIQF